MPCRIHALDSLTIDTIAAGEVIDLPASCIKELVDNALDALATKITIEVDVGGRERICVTDNGHGMCYEDVCTCIKRHTTSKLCKIDDLTNISSRGFRGEALASMTAISKATIVSAEHGISSVCPGTVLYAEGGTTLSVQETTAIPGTKVLIESLFYNVPARRKFLKSPTRDAQDIIKMVTLLALSAPHVSFNLIIDGKTSLSFEALSEKNTYADRAKQLFPDLFQKNASLIEYQDPHFSIKGMLASPNNTRSNRSLQYLLINDRPVVCPCISYAIKAAFGTAIEQNRHPIFAISIEMDQSMLDINVHPQKKEVRFADEESVRSAIYQAILQALFSVKDVYTVEKPSSQDHRIFQSRYPPTQPAESTPPMAVLAPPLIERKPVCLAIVGDVAFIQPEGETEGVDDPIIALDLREAMRSLLYSQAQNSDQSTSSQTLLIPITLQVPANEQALLQEAIPKLHNLGFSLRPFGHNSYLVETIPAHLEGVDIETFILDALHTGVVTAHDSHLNERLKALVHLQVAAMNSLKPPIAKDFAIGVFTSWVNLGRPKTAPDGSHCYASFTPKSIKSSIAKGNLCICHD